MRHNLCPKAFNKHSRIYNEISIPHSAFLLAEIPLSGSASSGSDFWMLQPGDHQVKVLPTNASGSYSSELSFVVLEAEEMNGKQPQNSPLHVQHYPLHGCSPHPLHQPHSSRKSTILASKVSYYTLF